MRFGRSFSAVLALAALGAQPLQAQFAERLTVTPAFGVMFPTGIVSDYVLPGPSFDIKVMYELSSRFSLGLEGAVDSHQGDPHASWTIFTGPPFLVTRYGVAAEISVLPPEPGRFAVDLGGGVGMAGYHSEKLYNPAEPPIGTPVGGPGQTEFSSNPLQFGGTYAAFNGMARIAYVYDESISLFVEGTMYRASVDEEKTTVFVQGPFPVARVDATGTTIIFEEREGPLEAPSSMSSFGIRIGFKKAF